MRKYSIKNNQNIQMENSSLVDLSESEIRFINYTHYTT